MSTAATEQSFSVARDEEYRKVTFKSHGNFAPAYDLQIDVSPESGLIMAVINGQDGEVLRADSTDGKELLKVIMLYADGGLRIEVESAMHRTFGDWTALETGAFLADICGPRFEDVMFSVYMDERDHEKHLPRDNSFYEKRSATTDE